MSNTTVMLLETDIMKYFIKTLSQKVCIILFTYTVCIFHYLFTAFVNHFLVFNPVSIINFHLI